MRVDRAVADSLKDDGDSCLNLGVHQRIMLGIRGTLQQKSGFSIVRLDEEYCIYGAI